MKIFKKQTTEKEIKELESERLQGVLQEILDILKKHEVKLFDALDVCMNLQLHLNRNIFRILNQENYDQSQPTSGGGQEGQGKSGV